MTDAPINTDAQNETNKLVAEYTADLTKYCDERVPPLLSNGQYAITCGALLIALTRQLARAAAAFGAANGQDPADVGVMVIRMFNKNYDLSRDAMGEGETVQ